MWYAQYGPTHWLAFIVQRSAFVDHIGVFGVVAPESEADFVEEDELRPLPRWSRLKSPSTLDTGYEACIGWPARSLWCSSVWRFTATYERGSRETSGLQMRWKARPVEQSDDELLLPLRPIWPGFAINTLFYAAILWLLTFGPFATRRFIRDKRGRCVKCGYDLRGSSGGGGGCPECGWGREAAV